MNKLRLGQEHMFVMYAMIVAFQFDLIKFPIQAKPFLDEETNNRHMVGDVASFAHNYFCFIYLYMYLFF